jgi:hypothetical protein
MPFLPWTLMLEARPVSPRGAPMSIGLGEQASRLLPVKPTMIKPRMAGMRSLWNKCTIVAVLESAGLDCRVIVRVYAECTDQARSEIYDLLLLDKRDTKAQYGILSY